MVRALPQYGINRIECENMEEERLAVPLALAAAFGTIAGVFTSSEVIGAIIFISAAFLLSRIGKWHSSRMDDEKEKEAGEEISEQWENLRAKPDLSEGDKKYLERKQRKNIASKHKSNPGVRDALYEQIDYQSAISNDGSIKRDKLDEWIAKGDSADDVNHLTDEDYVWAHRFGSYINDIILQAANERDDGIGILTDDHLDNLRLMMWLNDCPIQSILKNCTSYAEEEMGLFLFIMFEKSDCDFWKEWSQISRVFYYETMNPRPESKVILDELFDWDGRRKTAFNLSS